MPRNRFSVFFPFSSGSTPFSLRLCGGERGERSNSTTPSTAMPPLILHSRGGSADPQALKAVVAAAATGVAMELRRLPSSSGGDDASSSKSSSALRLELGPSSSGATLTQPNAIARFLGKSWNGIEKRRRRKERA